MSKNSDLNLNFENICDNFVFDILLQLKSDGLSGLSKKFTGVRRKYYWRYNSNNGNKPGQPSNSIGHKKIQNCNVDIA